MKNKNEAITKEFFLEYMEGLKIEIIKMVDIKIEYAIGEFARMINRSSEGVESRITKLEESLRFRA